MISEYEASKLRRDMHKELDGTRSALFKCAVGILVVVVLALVSPTVGVDREAAPQASMQTKAAAR